MRVRLEAQGVGRQAQPRLLGQSRGQRRLTAEAQQETLHTRAPLGVDGVERAGEFRGEFMISSEGDLESFTMTTKAGDVLDLEFNGGGVALTYNGVETGARAVRSDLDLLLAVASDEALYTDASASTEGLEESRQALRSRCTDNANGTTTCCTRLSCVTF